MMPNPRNAYQFVSARLKGRLRNARPGSVLILVVALLVLMALIGTAWLSTARTDRASTQQNSFNTEVDLLTQGVINMVKAELVNDVTSGGRARPATGYGPYDSVQNDRHLASRVPVLFRDIAPVHTILDPASVYANYAAADAANRRYEAGQFVQEGTDYYVCIKSHFTTGVAANSPPAVAGAPSAEPTYWRLAGTVAALEDRPVYPVVSAVANYAFADISGRPTAGAQLNVSVAASTSRTFLIPSTMSFANDPQFPAFIFFYPPNNRLERIPAADTDGDHIADALLFRLPVGTLGGVDYYAAVRVVDNGSAINASTAWRSSFRDRSGAAVGGPDEFAPDATPAELRLVGNFNPTNIDLRQIIQDFGGQTAVDAANQTDDLAAFRSPGNTLPPPFTSPAPLTYRFLSQFDNYWMQVGRRLANPYVAGSGLSATEGDALMYRGGTLVNPSVARSSLENGFQASLYNAIYNGPAGKKPNATGYVGTTAVDDWFNYNFDYQNRFPLTPPDPIVPPPQSVRALLAVRNGVSQLIPLRSATAVTPLAGATPPITQAMVPAGVAFMRPFDAAPAKTTVNTVGWNTALTPPAYDPNLAFNDLWRAYWGVMAEEWTNFNTRTPVSEAVRYFGYDVPGAWTPGQAADWLLDPYVGSKFTTDFTVTPPTFASVANPQHPARMFRSSIRAVKLGTPPAWAGTTPRIDPDWMLLLRAGLAAVNTMDQRDFDDNVTAMRVPIAVRSTAGTPSDMPANAIATVYGHERQPYLTEIFVHTNNQPKTDPPTGATPAVGLSNPAGYIAIEFHNPYNFPIDIANCKLAAINRTSTGGAPDLVLLDLSNANGNMTSSREDGDIVLSQAVSNMAGATNPYGGATVIPAYGYLVLENYMDLADAGLTPPPNSRAAAATYRPPSSKITPIIGKIPASAANTGVNYSYLPNLDLIYNREVVLMRPVSAVYEARDVDNFDADFLPTADVDTLVYGGGTPPPPASEFVIQDMVPLDSYDFTGMLHPTPPATYTGPVIALPPDAAFVAHAWHYQRGAPSAFSTNDHLWQFVYPGRYDANQTDTPTSAGSGYRYPRQQGTKQAFDPATVLTEKGWLGSTVDPWEVVGGNPAPGPTLDGSRTGATTDREATFPTAFTVQMSNLGWAGAVQDVGTPAYPFGGFARDGDLLQVPYMGAYRVQYAAVDGTDVVLELNAVTMDSIFTEDTDTTNDPDYTGAVVGTPQTYRAEQIGRFVPLHRDLRVFGHGSLGDSGNVPAMTPTADTATANTLVDDERIEAPADILGKTVVITGGTGQGQSRRILGYIQGTATTRGQLAFVRDWSVIPDSTSTYEIRDGHYGWATDLFDYLSVGGPQADFGPDTMQAVTPVPVSNDGGAIANEGRENTAPVHGLINLNTAPLPVLCAIPFFSPGDNNFAFSAAGVPTAGAGTSLPDNVEMAMAIVNYRDREIASGRVPFRSIMDLYRVPAFRSYSDYILLDAIDPGDSDDSSTAAIEPEGDITPPDIYGLRSDDGVRRDFEEQFLPLTRVSNLVTTRSDSFTNYILVQGWRGIGTTTPELVAQRRKAFTIDRSGVTESKRDVPPQFFFND